MHKPLVLGGVGGLGCMDMQEAEKECDPECLGISLRSWSVIFPEK